MFSLMHTLICAGNEIFIKRLLILLSLLVFSLSVSQTLRAQLGTAGVGSVKSKGTSKIITGTSVRVRSAPNTSSKEITQLNFGTIVKSSERSSNKDKVGDKEDYWYKVSTGNKSGWVFGSFLTNFDEKNSESIYLKIASERLKSETTNFNDYSDLLDFLTLISPQIKGQNNIAELELYKLQALAKSLESIPLDKLNAAPYKGWIAKNEAKIVYSEPAGQYFVRASLFWDLSGRYRNLPVGEKIAWAGANTSLPGECEGYIPCYVYLIAETYGKYLNLYPNGERTKEALQQMSIYFAPIIDSFNNDSGYTGPDSADERADMRKNLMQLRSAVMKTSDSATKSKVLNQIEQISKAYP